MPTGHDDIEARFSCPEFRQRLHARDREAVREICLRYLGHLMSHLKSKQHIHLLREEDWMDAVQAVFVKLLVKVIDLDPRRPLLPYLRAMVVNQATDMRRREHPSKQINAEISELSDLLDSGEDEPCEIAVNRERTDRLRDEMLRLSNRDQNAIQVGIRSSNRNRNKTLASQAGISPHAAQMQHQRALKKLSDRTENNEDRA